MDINTFLNDKLKKVNFNFVLLGILLVAGFLRFYHLEFQGAWIDEIHTLKQADPDLTFKEFHKVIMEREGIPHFYFLIVRFFGIIFTHSLFSIRLVSVLCGILSVYFIYLLGKELKDKNTGYIAAILLTIHPFHIEHSQEGRSYLLLVLFIIIAFYRLILFFKNVNFKNAILLGLFLGLITHAHPIGIVNIISIYVIIAIYFFFIKSKKEKINFFKLSFLSGIVTLIVFYPVYQIVSKLSQIQSFWVQEPSFDYIMHILSTLSGNNIVFYLIIISLFVLLGDVVYRIAKNKSNLQENQPLINVIIVLVWIIFTITFMIIKSQGGTSLMLSRYLISLMPVFMLTIALVISLIKKNSIRVLFTAFFVAVFMYIIFIEKKYYSTRTKAQFEEITRQVKELNPGNEIVVSSWGWLLGYFLDKDKIEKNVYEKKLDLYIYDVKINSVNQESFWYIDGNSRPFAVEPEIQAFIDENYTIDKSIELYDTWAKHFVSRKAPEKGVEIIKLNKFSNSQSDGGGELMFFENSKSEYPPLRLAPGTYEITVKGKSLPDVKIDDENAKINIIINGTIVKRVELSEKELNDYVVVFQHNEGDFVLGLEFINDLSKDNLDRNVLISKIKIKKVN